MKAKTPCLTRGCYRDVFNHGRCEEHYEPWDSSDRKERLPSDWQARRRVVIHRDGGKCQQCGQAGTDVDHKIAGDDHSLNNLQLLCVDCHKAKTHIEALHGRGIYQVARPSITPMQRKSKIAKMKEGRE